MDISTIVSLIADKIWGFPFLVGFLSICIAATIQLRLVQFRHFAEAFRMVFAPRKSSGELKQSGELTSFQAFINTLGANIGNGSLTGIPVAIYLGGPGSIFWLLIMSTFAIALRYAEVYLGMAFIGKQRFGSAKGGPMLYLSLLPAGAILSYAFAIFCLLYSFICGNVVQCNGVGLALQKTWGVSTFTTAFFVLATIAYILFGGSQRIVKYLDMLVPFKVAIFLISSLIVLIYHIHAIPHAFYLMFAYAFTSKAVAGGGIAFALQRAIAVGFQRGIFIHEAGLGTAAVAFGTTAGKNPAQDSIMSMLGVYINTHVVCLMVALSVIASGVWNNGETSSALIIDAYNTVFGQYGGWIITFLTINFGISVLVSYAYIGRVCWNFLTNNKYGFVFTLLYAGWAFLGTFMNVGLAWCASDLINAGLFVINIFGLVWFLQLIRKGLVDYEQQQI